MSFISHFRLRTRIIPTLTIAVVLALAAFPVFAASVPLQIGVDPFTQASCHASALTNHQANVEPDSFSNGSMIVAAYQVGRIYDGGACAIGFSTSTDNGATWTSGLLPGVTKYVGGGTFDRATDAAVAYDAQHNTWIISSLVLTEAGGVQGAGIRNSLSTNGGLTWPTVTSIPNTAGMISPDKNWIVCDNTATSPFYGNCYTELDDNGAGNRMEMSRSTDGGATWSVAATNSNGIIGGQPVVRPDGTVIVPTANANETAIGAFNSTNGGVSWSATTTIATIKHHSVAGSLREGPLPSAEIDGAGTFQRFLYVTLPSLQHVLLVTALLSTIWTSANLTQIFVLTGGGPNYATTTVPVLSYLVAIPGKQIGMGSAQSMMLVPFYCVLVYFLTRRMLRQD